MAPFWPNSPTNSPHAACVELTFRSTRWILTASERSPDWGEFDDVLTGVEAAQHAGLSVKINVVALKGFNDGEFESMVRWAHSRGVDITFIEVMPLGEVEVGQFGHHMPLTQVRTQLARHFDLKETTIEPAGRRGMCASAKLAA